MEFAPLAYETVFQNMQDPVIVIDEQRRIIGSTMHTRAHFAALVDVARRGAVRPPVAATFPLERIHEASSEFLAQQQA